MSRLAAKLVLPRPFDVHELCRRLSAERGRPIVLTSLPMTLLGPCGLWLAGERADIICYEQNTSVLHQEHIILHELGHILHEHSGAETMSELFPDLGGETLRIMMARQHDTFSGRAERQAENFAYKVLGRASRASGFRRALED
ncbi:ImmA/IrrE family metallo-endopeptidase [Lentzea kentuckyensis]|uniref:ImmA/IrrE family metallo-endopeptidase n=1 Tax=Lentzea kentuckyensis TaxID=360086 RepID=UPI000A3C82A0|nr:ImmA/IrrE family metallo-endopeptidase [Lentzea kentuckyensis]